MASAQEAPVEDGEFGAGGEERQGGSDRSGDRGRRNDEELESQGVVEGVNRFSWCDERQRYSAAAQAFKPLSKGSARETPCRRGRWDSGM